MANDSSGGELLPWQWPEAFWRGAVNKVRAGRSLKPAQWKDGARCAVALSFDSDHESSTLRAGSTSPGMLSQGEYGSRVAPPRILKLLDKHGVKASFFVPAVVAMLHPEEQRRAVAEGHEIGIHSWIHELNSALPPADERERYGAVMDVASDAAFAAYRRLIDDPALPAYFVAACGHL